MQNAKHRLILPLTAKSGIGKTFEAATRACWLNQHGIPWQAYDLDKDSEELSQLFPAQTELVALPGGDRDLDKLIPILRQTNAAPVTLVDPLPYKHRQLMRALQMTHFFDVAASENIGITVLVFPLNNFDVLANIESVCQFCGNRVDYVIVRNRFTAPLTNLFDGSQLEAELLNCGAASITVPGLSEYVKLQLIKLRVEQKRDIPFDEALRNHDLGLDILARNVLQGWLDTMFSEYDRIAAKLLPATDAAAIKPKHERPTELPHAKRGAKVNLSVDEPRRLPQHDSSLHPA